jgi:hypothetical protein
MSLIALKSTKKTAPCRELPVPDGDGDRRLADAAGTHDRDKAMTLKLG